MTIRKNNSLPFFLLQFSLFSAYLFFCAEGRRFRAFESSTDNSSSSVGTSKDLAEVGSVGIGDGLDKFVNNVKRMKNAGPSTPGVGHDNKFKYKVKRTFDEVMKSGPSPGAGHRWVNAFGEAEAMDSGGSPGNGHNKVTDYKRH
ncbi:hypothetical protein Syun_015177 [Stephania yunnanensis]|uniref:Uncharacterized protein n=1 Tax=Stephania yunnanensis TaxID=152371 RepID=A0AAP0P9G6_9MAGN